MKLGTCVLGIVALGAVAVHLHQDVGSEGSVRGIEGNEFVGDMVAKVANLILGKTDFAKYGISLTPLKCPESKVGMSSHIELQCGLDEILIENPPPSPGHLPFTSPFLMKLENLFVDVRCSVGAIAKWSLTGVTEEALCNVTKVNMMYPAPQIKGETGIQKGWFGEDRQDLSFKDSNIDLFVKRFARGQAASEDSSGQKSGPPLVAWKDVEIFMLEANITMNGNEMRWTYKQSVDIMNLMRAEGDDVSYLVFTIAKIADDLSDDFLVRAVKRFADDVGKGVGKAIDHLNPFANENHEEEQEERPRVVAPRDVIYGGL